MSDSLIRIGLLYDIYNLSFSCSKCFYVSDGESFYFCEKYKVNLGVFNPKPYKKCIEDAKAFMGENLLNMGLEKENRND